MGATAKAHAAKAQPESSRPQPPDPPPPKRMQEEKRREDTTYSENPDTTHDPGHSQQPVDPTPSEKGRGRGRGRQWERDDGVIEVEEEEDIDTLEVGNSMGITEISTSMTRTYESRAQRRFHQVCVHP